MLFLDKELCQQHRQPAQPQPAQQETTENFGGTYRCTVDYLRVRDAPGLGGTEVAQATGMSNATAGRRLQKIAEAGFIVKNGQKYVLTEAGHRLLGEIAQGR